MRLTQHQISIIKELTAEVFGEEAGVTLFGSRADGEQKGGDVDIMVTTEEPVERPAFMAARLSARISRELEGRQVDVVVNAPSLKRLPIHEIAERTGIRL